MKQYLAILKLSVLGLLLSFGLQYAFADWTPPPAVAPTCPAGSPGCEPPVNVGTEPQVKDGSLSVKAFIANMNAIFKQAVTVEQLAAPATEPQSVCTDQTGKLVGCGPKQHSGITDMVAFSLHYNGANNWVIEQTRVLLTSNPSRVGVPVQFVSAAKPGTGHYVLDLTWGGTYHIDSDEIVSATLITPNFNAIKLGLVDVDGNNRVEFVTSDDATLNDIPAGSEIKIIFVIPVVN